MAGNNIQSLNKIVFNTIEQFQEDINANFAILENSPLYKGVPGEEGEDGMQGLRGVRGIKFLFVDYTKFSEAFPGELSLASQVNTNFINSKLSSFLNKQKVLTCFGVTEFVDKDVIVLASSSMLSYNFISGIFEETGQSFNPETNLLSNINVIIENYVKYYIDNNPILNNLSNVLVPFNTYGKNYADNNSTFITNELTESSVFSPYIPGYNNQIGIPIENHKHFGYNDLEFPIQNKGTFVFGSMKRYYQLLMNTISTSGAETLSSDYAPGNNNIPSAVFLQDTYRNGIYLGHKDKTNLKRFGSIFKNENNDLVLKSDSSMNASEFSELLINRAYMRFTKLVQFFDSLEVSRDLSVFGDVNNKHLKSGKFTAGANLGNNYNFNKSEHGAAGTGTVKLNVSEFEDYTHYLGKVLITNQNGRVSKEYTLENAVLNQDNIIDLEQIANIPNSQYHVLTSNYFKFLADKINSANAYISGNYWRKDQYGTREIPRLEVSGGLHAQQSLTVGNSLLNVFQQFSSVGIAAQNLDILSENVHFGQFSNKVLVVNSDGSLSKNYELLKTDIVLEPNVITGNLVLPILGAPEPDKKILTAKYWNYLRSAINFNNTFMTGNYWRKDEYMTGVIPSLKLNTSLEVDYGTSNGIVRFANNHGSHFDLRKNKTLTATLLVLGNSSDIIPTNLYLDTNSIYYTKFVDKVIVTDANGKVLNKYSIYTGNFGYQFLQLSNNGIPYTIPSFNTTDNLTQTEKESRIPNHSTIDKLQQMIVQSINWVISNFWRKDQFNTAEIPAIHVNSTLKANGNVKFGNQNDPNIETDSNVTKVGKTSSDTELRGSLKMNNYQDKVIVTNNLGDVLQEYSLEKIHPYSGPNTGGFADSEIYADYWIKHLQPQPFNDFPNSDKKVVTSNYISWIVSHLKAIRTLIFDRPTYAELNSLITNALPQGTIIYWNNVFGAVPSGYVICDGRQIPGTTLFTPNLINKFVKNGLIPNVNGGNNNHQSAITLNNIPSHSHQIPQHRHRMFTNEVGGGNILVFTPNSYVRHRAYQTYDGEKYVMGASYDNQAPSVGWGGYSSLMQTGFEGLTSPDKLNIEPQSYTLIPIMKY